MFNLIYADLYVDINADFFDTIDLKEESFEDYDFFSSLRKSYTSDIYVPFGISDVEYYSNKVGLILPASITCLLKAGRYYYDVFGRNKETLKTYKIQEGQVQVSPSATNIPLNEDA